MDSLTRFTLSTLALLTLVSAPACLLDEKVGGNPTDGSSGADDTTDSDSAPTSDATTGSSTDASTTGPSTTDASTTGASTTGASTGETTGTGSTTADPLYMRECQPGDFVCDDWGCQGVTQAGECYKPCTPSGEIGGVDSECDEPERPFCSQLGLAFGGDFDCNGCAHVCMAEPHNWCDYGPSECG